MKKFSLVFMAMFTLLLGSILSACSFKKPEISFNVAEIVLSANQSQNLNDVLQVEGTDKRNISFLASDKALMSVEGSSLVATSNFGKGFVYAIFENNTVATLPVVVKKKFSAPTNVKYADGVLSWDIVQEYFADEQVPTTASSYLIEGSFVDAQGNTNQFSEVSNSTSQQISVAGTYALTVTAVGTGYFDSSDKAKISSGDGTFYHDKILPASNLAFDEQGLLIWQSEDADAEFQVELDGVLLGSKQAEKSLAMAEFFEQKAAGEHNIRVFSFDKNEKKLSTVSRTLTINKLMTPTARIENGVLIVPYISGAESILVEGLGEEPTTLSNLQGGIETYFEGVEAGTYSFNLTAIGGENTFRSNRQNFADVKKLEKVGISGKGGNELDGTSFALSVSGNVENESKVVVFGHGEEEFSADSLQNLSLTLSQPGSFEIKAFQTQENANVLRSDNSEGLKIVKFSAIDGEILHTVDLLGNSEFAFSEPAEAPLFEMQYTLQLKKGEDWEDIESVYQDGKLIVSQGIAKHLSGDSTLRIVAECADSSISIGTFKEKDLSLLQTPTTANKKFSELSEATYMWNGVEKAQDYLVRIFAIDKDDFQNGSFDSNGKESVDVKVESATQIVLSQTMNGDKPFGVGYYALEVYAIPTDPDNFVANAKPLAELFYVYTTLELGDVKFGYGTFSDVKSYFVQMENLENISSFDITVEEGRAVNQNASSKEATIYLVEQDFSAETTISVVAKNSDNTLYRDSQEKSLTIKKLSSLQAENIKTDLFGNLLSIDFESLSEKDNISRILVKKGNAESNFYNGQDGVFDISQFAEDEIDLSFDVFGSEKVSAEDVETDSQIGEDVSLYQDANGKVFIEAEQKVLKFKRLSAPSGLRYNDGVLKMEHSSAASAQGYVVVLHCFDADDSDDEFKEIVLNFKENSVEATFGQHVETIEEKKYETDSTQVSISVNDVIEQITRSGELSDLYNQFVDIKFVVYAFCRRNSQTEVVLTSKAASTSDGKQQLSVPKMASVENFVYKGLEGQNYVLTWDPDQSIYAADTTYDIYCDAEKLNEQALTNTKFSISVSMLPAGESKTFHVRASNPHCLESGISKYITLHKLLGVQALTLVEGKLQFEIESSDLGKYSQVMFAKDGADAQPLQENSISIDGAGKYSLQLTEKEEETIIGTTYHISSDVSVWNLQLMNSLLPEGKDMTFGDDKISWNAFGGNLKNIEYVLFFQSGENIAKVTTTKTELLYTDSTFIDAISTLSGEITVQLAAHIKTSINTNDPYSVPKSVESETGGIIYFALANETLLDKTLESTFNYEIYSSEGNVKKLDAPVVENVEFVVDGDLSKADLPSIKLTITDGNYENETTFQFEISDNVITKSVAKNEQGKYVIEITSAEYNKVAPGTTLSLDIVATKDSSGTKTLPSAFGNVEIRRADNISSMQFASEENGLGLASILNIKFASEKESLASGGVVVAITLGEDTKYYEKAYDGTLDDSMAFDIADFIQEHGQDGGALTISAFIKSDSAARILASGRSTPLYATLLPALKEENITAKEGGIVVETQTGNTVVLSSDKTYQLSSANEFTFIFPDTWENGKEYSMTFQVMHSDSVSSAKITKQITLQRIGNVGPVTLTRSNENDVQMTWKNVDGAAKYKMKVFVVGETDVLVAEDENIESTSILLTDLLGENYEKLGLTKDEKTNGAKLRFELVAVASEVGKHNSLTYNFTGTVLGNPITKQSISTPLGVVEFASQAGTTYIYRLVSQDGKTLLNWKSVVAQGDSVKIDTRTSLDGAFKDIAGGSAFNLEVFLAGSASSDGKVSSDDYSFSFDSITFVSGDEGISFEKLADIESISSESGNITFALKNESATERQILASNKEDGIYSDPENVVSFTPTLLRDSGVDDTQAIYGFEFSALLDLFKEKGISLGGQTKIYFWTYSETLDDNQTFVSSAVKDYTFIVDTEAKFIEIRKGDEKESGLKDFVNTYAVFAGDDAAAVTQGFYARVLDENGEVLLTYFFNNVAMQNVTYNIEEQQKNGYAINLTQMFDENLDEKFGKFKIQFARLSQLESQVAISPWWQLEKELERMAPVENLKIDGGNLFWTKTNDNQQAFYVYTTSVQPEDNKIPLNSSCDIVKGPTRFDIASKAITGTNLYLAVRAVNETNPYVLTSSPKFYGDDEARSVHKNQITNPIILKDGKISISWENSDFIAMLKNSELPNSTKLERLFNDYFEIPFTFSFTDLLDGNVKMRMRFTALKDSDGVSTTITINALDLLANLNNADESLLAYINGANGLLSFATSTTQRGYLERFVSILNSKKDGIADENTLFDDCFEELQMGGYSLDYYLLGGSTTLNSGIKSFENTSASLGQENKNVIYVNAQPQVNIKIQQTTDKTINDFKVIFKKAKIYTNAQGATDFAKAYVLKIGEMAFSITLNGENSGGTLEQIGGTKTSINVYESDEDGNDVGQDGDYLMFYLNHNVDAVHTNGNSICGEFQIASQAQQFQIYAVGNDISMSSKSEYFRLTALHFSDFSVVDGQFVWKSYVGHPTTISIAERGDRLPDTFEVSGINETSTYDLSDKNPGQYTVRFVLLGDFDKKEITLDSEIYIVETAYKLSAPTLDTVLGDISIDTKDLRTQLASAYSDNSLYTYRMSNNISSTSPNDSTIYYDIIDSSAQFRYQAGVTGLDESDPSYNFKYNESLATEFYLHAVGSTSTLAVVDSNQDVVDNNKNQGHHIKYLRPQDKTTMQAVAKPVAIKSDTAIGKMATFGAVESPLRIDEGVLSWGEVTMRNANYRLFKEDEKIPENIKIVYKVVVSQYQKSGVESDPSQIKEAETYYTINNSFDFVNVPVVEENNVFIKVSVSAFVASYSESMPETPYEELVEGGYVYGSANYIDDESTEEVDESEYAVLLGNDAVSEEISRINPVENVVVEDGKLVWDFTIQGVTANNLLSRYKFIVEDDEKNSVDGTFKVEVANEQTSTFKITFTDKDMKTGRHLVTVYVTQTSDYHLPLVKSYGKSIEIVKLEKIKAGDYTIETSEDGSYEILDFAKYFESSNSDLTAADKEIHATIGGQEFVFTSAKTKLKILDAAVSGALPEEFVGQIVITSQTSITFVVKSKAHIDEVNVLYSDENAIIMSRSEWSAEDRISWDAETEVFKWNFTKRSLSANATARPKREANVIMTETGVYSSVDIYSPSNRVPDIILSVGTEIVVVENRGVVTEIQYQEETYYIPTNTWAPSYVEDEDGEDKELDVSVLFDFVDIFGSDTIIRLDGRLYAVPTSSVAVPSFYVTVTYKTSSGDIVRTYTTTEMEFMPTVICDQVTISLRVKLNSNSIRSTELTYLGEEENFVNFNLFAQGEGTAANPYRILESGELSVEQQFENIKHRMTKPSYLNSFVAGENHESRTEDNYFSFAIGNGSDNIVINLTFEGIFLKGEFSGHINGNGNTISYTSTGVSEISPLNVSAGFYSSSGDLQFTYGTALFEKLTQDGSISNLDLQVKYARDRAIVRSSLIAGLTIVNSGQISSVTLKGFDSNFYAQISGTGASERAVMAYSGIAALNVSASPDRVARISNCEVDIENSASEQTNKKMSIYGRNTSGQAIFLSGIAYTNQAEISGCTTASGVEIEVSSQNFSDFLQIAGIAVTNASGGRVNSCVNNANISASATNGGVQSTYLAGICDCQRGSLDGNNQNHGQINAVTIPNAQTGNIYVGDQA